MHRIKEYPSVGWCIYCGAPDWWCQIDDEHIVPSAFGANHILRGASCHGCAGTTSYLTGYCSHVIFEPLIVHHRVPRKRRKKEMTTHLPIRETFAPDPRSAPEVLVPVERHPDMVLLPVFGLPGILAGRPPNQPLEPTGIWIKAPTDDLDDRTKRLMASGLS